MPLPQDYYEMLERLDMLPKATQEDLSKVARFSLTKEEKNSALWLKISQQLQQRLEYLDKMNRNGLTYAETCVVRGGIREVEAFLDIAAIEDSFDLRTEGDLTPDDGNRDAL